MWSSSCLLDVKKYDHVLKADDNASKSIAGHRDRYPRGPQQGHDDVYCPVVLKSFTFTGVGISSRSRAQHAAGRGTKVTGRSMTARVCVFSLSRAIRKGIFRSFQTILPHPSLGSFSFVLLPLLSPVNRRVHVDIVYMMKVRLHACLSYSSKNLSCTAVAVNFFPDASSLAIPLATPSSTFLRFGAMPLFVEDSRDLRIFEGNLEWWMPHI